MINKNLKISILGLGYVGLPLAIGFSKKYKVVGYDINNSRITELRNGIDRTKEIKNKNDLKNKNLIFSSKSSCMASSDFYIITVPTPITKKNQPDLSIIKEAAITVAKVIKKILTIKVPSRSIPIYSYLLTIRINIFIFID